MTTNLADQERTRRRASATADEMRSPASRRSCLEVSFARRPDPESSGISEADAAWPQRMRRLARASLTHWGRSDLMETAELLLTELVTNALRHARGAEIGVRFYLKDDQLVIEVNDGSPLVPVPRPAGPDDENGRGLLLVEALAGSWGVSADGTTTWCTLPLTKGPSDMEPAAVTAPVLREMPLDLPPDSSAVTIARVSGRTKLTMLDWHGNGHAAIAVLGTLVDNAVAYGLTPGKTRQSLSARLGVTEAQQLIIDVTDPNPLFPNFAEAVDGTIGRGLWNARQHGARLSWFVASDFEGKTVRATFQPGRVDL
ncbi:ATP-binding protein [Streptomyces griseoloalbus]|uniref:ATP-binding protein n=1 Tax=Streptomyces griseoloalbus TaxID=67303 RepID=A0ABV3ED17_9ACTN